MLIAKGWQEVIKQYTLKLNNTHDLYAHYPTQEGTINLIGLHDERYIAYRGLGVNLPLTRDDLFDVALSGTVALVILVDGLFYQDEGLMVELTNMVNNFKTLGITTLDIIHINEGEQESINIERE